MDLVIAQTADLLAQYMLSPGQTVFAACFSKHVFLLEILVA